MRPSGADEFIPSGLSSAAQWPEAPDRWSYSSLRDAEECPRRWMLYHATYPSVWQGVGFPSKPSLPGLVGDVTHGVIELIVRKLHDLGCESLAEPRASEALRELGGYSKAIGRVIGERMDALETNPRVAHRIPAMRAALAARTPEIRRAVQSMVTRTTLKPVRTSERAGVGHRGRRAPLQEGSHPEVWLHAQDLRFWGRADLVTLDGDGCTIVDFKTGAPAAHHADQLGTYAVLWNGDRELNPRSVPVRRLQLTYPAHDVDVAPPSAEEAAELATELMHRSSTVASELGQRPPPARPALDMCRRCGVRQMCDDYWAGPAVELLGADVDFIDCEAVVLSENGPRSWIISIPADGTRGLLRTPTETAAFAVGDRVRLLDTAFVRDEELDRTILTLTQWSEVSVLAPSDYAEAEEVSECGSNLPPGTRGKGDPKPTT
ncbi:PD-(D/E)XK nuclease family protein [Filomicrobium sp.]|uniref:PD-(D/E)XK nuclease family protein n=1 Tax=Filomicrobium sp. TaxID=2024831 RepID=UPI00258E78AB|nr:PD-(D/E)XK nuclease family protein [Filomicrobium sp.]MCV0371904.1 PD-(D/E)XK nuclease family protein [Filomicrobium sp.]